MSGMDITTLGLAIDSSQVGKARDELGRFVAAGDKAAGTATKMEASWGKLKGVLAGLALGATIGELVKMADSMTLVDARLKLATGNAQDFAKAQALVYKIAQQSNVGLAETATLFTKLHEPVKRMGGDVATTGKIVESFSASLRVGGASAQEAASATLQFAQAMGSGKLQGDEFRAIAEASPRFMKALADGMGVPIEQLKKMGSEGKLTADVVGNALVKSLDQLKKEMASIPDTVGGAMTRLTNDFKVAINDINKASGTTLGLAGVIEAARGLIPSLKDEAIEAFKGIGTWIDSNKQGLNEAWTAFKGLVGDVWEGVKAVASLAGFVGEVVAQSGALKVVWEAARLLLAGFKDGVELIGASLAHIGSSIMQFLVFPLVEGGKIAAAIASVFDKELAAKVQASVDSIKEFTEAGEQYAAGVVQKFADGKSAVGTLSESMKAAATATTVATTAAVESATAITTLKNKHTELTDEQKKSLQAYKDLSQNIRERIEQLDQEAAGGVKLNDAEKALIKYKQELTDKYKEWTPKQREAVELLFAEWDAKIKTAEATKLLEEANIAAAKAWEEMYTKLGEQTDQLKEQVAQQNAVNLTTKTGVDHVAKLTVAKLREKAVLSELKAIKVEDKNLDMALGQQYRSNAAELRNLADALEAASGAQLLKKVDDFLDPNKAESFGEALTKAFDGAGNSLAKLTNTLGDYAKKQKQINELMTAVKDDETLTSAEKLDRQNKLLKEQGQLGVSTFASIAGAAKGFFEEGSKGYKALEAAETAFRAFMLASDLIKGASAAAVAIANQAQGDPYTAFPRMAAMAAAMAALGFATGFFGSSGPAPVDAKKRQEQTGTGTVFGDLDAKSESIANSIEIMEDAAVMGLEYQSGMLDALRNIEAAMGGVANQILRQGTLTTGKNFGIQEGVIGINSPTAMRNTLTGLATAVGGPLLGGLANGLMKAVDKLGLWGKTKQSIADTGLNVQGTVGNLGATQYADVTTTSSSWFGLRKKTTNSTVTGAAPQEITDQFRLIFNSVSDALKMSAEQLGQDADATAAAISNFVIDIANLSLKDMSGEEVQEAIAAAVGAQSDKMAQAILPGLESFQKVGEGYFETLVRVAAGTETAQVVLERLGVTAIDYTAILEKQGDVAAEIVKQSLVAAETAGGSLSSVGKLISTLDGSAEDIAGAYTTLIDLRKSLVEMGKSGDSLTATLIRSAGGLDELAASIADYQDEFFSDQEKTAMGLARLTEAFKALGYDSLPKTREEFRALVDGIDETTDSGQALLGKVLGLSGQFARLVPSTKDLAEAAEEAAKEVADLSKELADTFKNLVSTLKDELGKAFDTLTDSVNAEKGALQSAYDAQVEVIDAAADAAKAQYEALMKRIDDDRKTARAKYEAEMALIKAAKAALDSAEDAQQKGYAAAVKAVDAERTSAREAYAKASAQLNASMKTAGDTVSKLKSLNDTLRSTLNELNPIGSDARVRSDAQEQIRAMSRALKDTGAIPDANKLKAALSAVSKPSEDLFGSFEDYLRDFYRTSIDISDLAKATEDSLDAAQTELDAIVQMKEAADLAHAENMARLDGIKEALEVANALAKEQFELQRSRLDKQADDAQGQYDTTTKNLDDQAEAGKSSLDATLEALQGVKDGLKEKLDQDLQALNDLLATAKAQYEQLVGINNGTKTVAQAMADLAKAMGAFSQVTNRPVPSGPVTPSVQTNQWATNGAVQTFTDTAGAVAVQATGNTNAAQTVIHGSNGANVTLADATTFVQNTLGTGNVGAVTQAAGTYGVSLQNVDLIGGYTSGTVAALAAGDTAKVGQFTVAEIKAFVNDRLKADKPKDIYDAAKQYGYTLNTLDAIMGWPAGTATKWATDNNLPAFAAGGFHGGGLRLVGEHGPEIEATGASRIWTLDQLMSQLRDPGAANEVLVRQVQSLQQELAQMRAEMRAGQEAVANNTGRTARQLERWDTDGLPETTTA